MDTGLEPPSYPKAINVKTAPDYNCTQLDFHQPMPRPRVRGKIIDFHCHIVAARHARTWFETADHFGIDTFVNMMPLEEALTLQREWGHRMLLIAVPSWLQQVDDPMGDWLHRIDAFYNLGSRIVKFHFAPESMRRRGWRFDSPEVDAVIRAVVGRGMGIMTHMGDPDSWYAGKYADASVYGTRQDHYQQWETVMSRWPAVPWVGAHMGGHPEDLAHLQRLLDAHPSLHLDCSATKWVSRSLSDHHDNARAFFLRNQDRILFGSDQVSSDDRGFDFLASRFWVQRTMWETDYVGPSPIRDADAPGGVTTLRGLALPDDVLQKLYHNNAVNYLREVGVKTDWLE